MTLVQGPSLKCTYTRSQEFRSNNIHYAFISAVMILVNFKRKIITFLKAQGVYFKHETNRKPSDFPLLEL